MTVSVPRIEKLLAELQEPWRIYGDQILDRHDDFVCELAEPEDADLICQAVNALPALIAAVKALHVLDEEEGGLPESWGKAQEALAPFSFEEQATSSA